MAALTFQDSILDRILANVGIYPAGYDPNVDGPEPEFYAINGTQFSVTFMETHEKKTTGQPGRFSEHTPQGSVATLETFWNIAAGGEGETEINWLIGQYNSSTNKDAWVISVARLFSTIEMDATVGVGAGGYRSSGDNGYTNKQNLKDWVNAIP